MNPHHKGEVSIQNTEAVGTYDLDWEFTSGIGDLDECNGIQIEINTYI